jgi:hypothetical protein
MVFWISVDNSISINTTDTNYIGTLTTFKLYIYITSQSASFIMICGSLTFIHKPPDRRESSMRNRPNVTCLPLVQFQNLSLRHALDQFLNLFLVSDALINQLPSMRLPGKSGSGVDSALRLPLNVREAAGALGSGVILSFHCYAFMERPARSNLG